MSFLPLLLAASTPWLVLLVPGVLLPRFQQSSLAYFSRILLWSASVWTLVSFLIIWLRLPSLWVVLAMTGITGALWWWHRAETQRWSRQDWLPLFFLGVTYLFFSVAFWYFHDALPTGDSQKAIFWGTGALQQQALPDYQASLTLLNRDPVDFFTPGLHALTAVLMRYSPDALASIGFFSLAVAGSVALLAVSFTEILAPGSPRVLLYLAGGLVLTNLRFLRYLREPGYHYQNIVGELLLFGLLYLGISLIKKWWWWDILLALLIFLALLISHQFSAFLSFFALLPVVVALGIRYVPTHLRQHLSPLKLTALLTSFGLSIAAGFSLGLHHKIPHIFTTTPHLRHLVLVWYEYPRTLGFWLVYLGLLGLLLLLWQKPRRGEAIAFAAVTLTLLALSYGPYLGIDIPPVRALLYSVVPLASLSAVVLVALYQRERVGARTRFIFFLLVLLLAGSGTQTLYGALLPRHQVRTNSTLTPAQVRLTTQLAGGADVGAIVIDDYNRRSSSWLLLAGRPTFTRLAAELKTQMAEARQSPSRKELYLNHLAYEKIFSLGSFPEISTVLTQYQVAYLTGVTPGSADAFAHNPALQKVTEADDLTIFRPTVTTETRVAPEIATWLLRPSTLANDIGDDEDTFEHLPASLRAARVSPPLVSATATWRTTSAPVIVLRFNVRDYVAVLWAKEGRRQPDTAVEFYWQTTHAVEGLALRTATGARAALTNHAMIRLEQQSVPFDADGFITLYIDNPAQQEVPIDAIALGLARIP